MAIVTDALGRKWDSAKHPRDRKGRFIRTGRGVRLFDTGGTKAWGTGTVDSITDEGHINITITKVRGDGSAKGKVGQKVVLPASSLESMNERGDLAAARAAAKGSVKAGVPNANVTQGDKGNGGNGLAKVIESQKNSGHGSGPVAFGLSTGFHPDDTNSAAKIIKGQMDPKTSPNGAYLVGLWAHNERNNGKMDDNDFVALMDDLGADPTKTDDSPDGLTGLQDLVDKFNASNPNKGEWPDVVPRATRREREHASGARVGQGAHLISNDEGKKFVALDKFIVTKDSNGNWTAQKWVPNKDSGSATVFDAARGLNDGDKPETKADLTPEETPTPDQSLEDDFFGLPKGAEKTEEAEPVDQDLREAADRWYSGTQNYNERDGRTMEPILKDAVANAPFVEGTVFRGDFDRELEIGDTYDVEPESWSKDEGMSWLFAEGGQGKRAMYEIPDGVEGLELKYIVSDDPGSEIVTGGKFKVVGKRMEDGQDGPMPFYTLEVVEPYKGDKKADLTPEADAAPEKDEKQAPDFPSPEKIANGLEGRFDDEQRPARGTYNIGDGKKASFEQTDDEDIYDVSITDEDDNEVYSGEHDVSQPADELAADLYESATGERYDAPTKKADLTPDEDVVDDIPEADISDEELDTVLDDTEPDVPEADTDTPKGMPDMFHQKRLRGISGATSRDRLDDGQALHRWEHDNGRISDKQFEEIETAYDKRVSEIGEDGREAPPSGGKDLRSVASVKKGDSVQAQRLLAGNEPVYEEGVVDRTYTLLEGGKNKKFVDVRFEDGRVKTYSENIAKSQIKKADTPDKDAPQADAPVEKTPEVRFGDTVGDGEGAEVDPAEQSVFDRSVEMPESALDGMDGISDIWDSILDEESNTELYGYQTQRSNPENYTNNGRGSLKNGKTETRVGTDENGMPYLYDVTPILKGEEAEPAKGSKPLEGESSRGVREIEGSRRPFKHAYRIVSEEEYENSVSSGYLQSDGRGNVMEGEGTVASLRSTGDFYAPWSLFDSTTGTRPLENQKARIVRIKLDPSDGWKIDSDGYIKTTEKIPVTSYDLVSPAFSRDQSFSQSMKEHNEDRIGNLFKYEPDITNEEVNRRRNGGDGYTPLTDEQITEARVNAQRRSDAYDALTPEQQEVYDDNKFKGIPHDENMRLVSEETGQEVEPENAPFNFGPDGAIEDTSDFDWDGTASTDVPASMVREGDHIEYKVRRGNRYESERGVVTKVTPKVDKDTGETYGYTITTDKRDTTGTPSVKLFNGDEDLNGRLPEDTRTPAQRVKGKTITEQGELLGEMSDADLDSIEAELEGDDSESAKVTRLTLDAERNRRGRGGNDGDTEPESPTPAPDADGPEDLTPDLNSRQTDAVLDEVTNWTSDENSDSLRKAASRFEDAENLNMDDLKVLHDVIQDRADELGQPDNSTEDKKKSRLLKAAANKFREAIETNGGSLDERGEERGDQSGRDGVPSDPRTDPELPSNDGVARESDSTGEGTPGSQGNTGEDRGSSVTQLHLIGEDGTARDITPAATHATPEGRRADLEANGFSTPDLYELDPADADVFRHALSESKNENKHGASVTVYPLEDYQNMRLFLTEDGKSGIALNGDDIVSAFSSKDASNKRVVNSMMSTAIELGGRRADSFDTVLPEIYAAEGLVAVARIKWNEDYAPEGWDKGVFSSERNPTGEPDVVLYAYDPEKVGGSYDPATAKEFDDFDAAAARVQEYLDGDKSGVDSDFRDDSINDPASVDPASPLQGRKDSLIAGIESGIKTRGEYLDEVGVNGKVEKITFNDGTVGIRKFVERGDGAFEQNELFEKLAEKTGARTSVSVSFRDPKDGEEYLLSDFITGKHTSSFDNQDFPEILKSKEGIGLGVADFLSGNPDRHEKNWILGRDNLPTAIDNDITDYMSPGTDGEFSSAAVDQDLFSSDDIRRIAREFAPEIKKIHDTGSWQEDEDPVANFNKNAEILAELIDRKNGKKPSVEFDRPQTLKPFVDLLTDDELANASANSWAPRAFNEEIERRNSDTPEIRADEDGPLDDQTPVQLDEKIAKITGEGQKAISAMEGHASKLKRYTRPKNLTFRDNDNRSDSEVFRDANDAVINNPNGNTTREIIEIGESLKGYNIADLERQDVLDRLAPYEAEYDEKKWNRAFLVRNMGGHVHKDRNCSSCFPTTQYQWMTEYSGKDEAEIIDAAGDRACTVCYPNAPVSSLNKPSKMLTDEEISKADARALREQKRDAKAQEQIVKGLTPDGEPLSVPTGTGRLLRDGNPATQSIKTERAGWNEVSRMISYPIISEIDNSSDYRYSIDEHQADKIHAIVDALAWKNNTTPQDIIEQATEKARQSLKREGSSNWNEDLKTGDLVISHDGVDLIIPAVRGDKRSVPTIPSEFSGKPIEVNRLVKDGHSISEVPEGGIVDLENGWKYERGVGGGNVYHDDMPEAPIALGDDEFDVADPQSFKDKAIAAATVRAEAVEDAGEDRIEEVPESSRQDDTRETVEEEIAQSLGGLSWINSGGPGKREDSTGTYDHGYVIEDRQNGTRADIYRDGELKRSETFEDREQARTFIQNYENKLRDNPPTDSYDRKSVNDDLINEALEEARPTSGAGDGDNSGNTPEAPGGNDEPDEEPINIGVVDPENLPFERTEPITLEGEKYPPTRQQQDVIDAVHADLDVKVQAKAGSGKTSTLEALARRWKKSHPDQNIIYVAFNGSVQKEAQKRMPDNVESRTGHSIANKWNRTVNPWLMNKFSKGGMVNGDEVGTHLGVSKSGLGDLDRADVARGVVESIGAYSYSADDTPLDSHLAPIFNGLNQADRAAALELTKRGWEDIMSPNGKLKITHDHYRKVWALSRPDLTDGTGGNRKAQILFIDEAQDTPPVLAKVVSDQNMQKVIVGDADQAIYGFTGATDYLSVADADTELPLNKSWRFGPAIADIANRALQILGSRERVIGAGKDSKIVDTMDEPDAILTRSNAGMIGEIMDQMKRGRKVGVPKNTKGDILSLIDSAEALKFGKKIPRMHDDLAAYKNWDELTREAQRGNNPKASMIVNIFSEIDFNTLRGYMNNVIDGDGSADVAGITDHMERINVPEGIQLQTGYKSEKKAWDLFKELDLASDGWAYGFTGEVYQKDLPRYKKKKGDKKKGVVWKGDPSEYDAAYQNVVDKVNNHYGSGQGKPDVTISTAHKAKGLEWNKVKIGDDFRGPEADKNTGDIVMPDAEEMRLIYVAVTRAEGELYTGSLDWLFDYSDENGGVPEAKEPERENLQERVDAAKEKLEDKNHAEDPDLEPSVDTTPDTEDSEVLDENGESVDQTSRPKPTGLQPPEDIIEETGETIVEDTSVEPTNLPPSNVPIPDRAVKPDSEKTSTERIADRIRKDSSGQVLDTGDLDAPLEDGYSYTLNTDEDEADRRTVIVSAPDGETVLDGYYYGNDEGLFVDDIAGDINDAIEEHKNRKESEEVAAPEAPTPRVRRDLTDDGYTYETYPDPENPNSWQIDIYGPDGDGIGYTYYVEEEPTLEEMREFFKDQLANHREGKDAEAPREDITPEVEEVPEPEPVVEPAPTRAPEPVKEEPAVVAPTPAGDTPRTKREILSELDDDQFDQYDDLDRDQKPAYIDAVNAGDDHDTALAKANGTYVEPEQTFDEKYPDIDGTESPEDIARKADELQDLFKNTNPTDPDYPKIAGKAIEYLAESRSKPASGTNANEQSRPESVSAPVQPPTPEPAPAVAPEPKKTKAQRQSERMGTNIRDFKAGKDVVLTDEENEWLVQLEMTLRSDEGLSIDDLLDGENPAITNYLKWMEDNEGAYRWWEKNGEAGSKMRIGDMAYQTFEDTEKGKAHRRGEGPPDVRYGPIVHFPTHSQPNITILALDENGDPIPSDTERGGFKLYRYHMGRVSKFQGFGDDGYPRTTSGPDGNPNTPTTPPAPQTPTVPEAPDTSVPDGNPNTPTTPRGPGNSPNRPNEDTLDIIQSPYNQSNTYKLMNGADSDKFEVAKIATNNFENLNDGDSLSFGGGPEAFYDGDTDSMLLYDKLNYVGSMSMSDFREDDGGATVDRLTAIRNGGGFNEDNPTFEFEKIPKQVMLRPYERFGPVVVEDARRELKHVFMANGHTVVSEVDLNVNDMEYLTSSAQVTLRAVDGALNGRKIRFLVPEADVFVRDNPESLVLGFVIIDGAPTIHINPKMMTHRIHVKSATDSAPGHFMDAGYDFDDLRYTMMHEMGHIMDQVDKATWSHTDSNDPNYIVKTAESVAFWETQRPGFSNYGASSVHEGYAEAWAQWILGGKGSSPVSDAYAIEYGWDDPSSIGQVVE